MILKLLQYQVVPSRSRRDEDNTIRVVVLTILVFAALC